MTTNPRGDGTLPTTSGSGGEKEEEEETWIVTLGWDISPPTLPPGDFQLSTRLVFGTVPALSVNRRVVLLRSTAEVDYDFNWDLGAVGGVGIDGDCKVEPKSGVLPAGGTVFCKVVFTAGAKPQVFDGSVRCELSPVSPSAEEVAAAEQRWRKASREKCSRFTVRLSRAQTQKLKPAGVRLRV